MMVKRVNDSKRNTLETILIVEDHPIVLQVVRAILERAGFCVLAAGNCAQAIQAENGARGDIHLLLADVMMPDMSGPAVAKLLQEHRPEMQVMLMSGYSERDRLFLNHGWHFIEKPFLPAQLVARVNEVLHTLQCSQGDNHCYAGLEPRALTAVA
jgi:DNA-binding response OmpR family regulator